MTREEVIRRACTEKVKYGHSGASEAAERLRRIGSPVSPYRCPFCGSWHVGHPPSMDGMEKLARAIRGLDDPDEI